VAYRVKGKKERDVHVMEKECINKKKLGIVKEIVKR